MVRQVRLLRNYLNMNMRFRWELSKLRLVIAILRELKRAKVLSLDKLLEQPGRLEEGMLIASWICEANAMMKQRLIWTEILLRFYWQDLIRLQLFTVLVLVRVEQGLGNTAAAASIYS